MEMGEVAAKSGNRLQALAGWVFAALAALFSLAAVGAFVTLTFRGGQGRPAPWWAIVIPVMICGLLAMASFLKAKQLLRRTPLQPGAAPVVPPDEASKARQLLQRAASPDGGRPPVSAEAAAAADKFLAETVKSGVLEKDPLYVVKKMLEQAEASGHGDDPRLLAPLTVLVASYSHQGRHAEAEPFARRALAIAEKVYGPDHPEVALRLSMLAMVCSDLRRYVEAEPLITRAHADDVAGD